MTLEELAAAAAIATGAGAMLAGVYRIAGAVTATNVNLRALRASGARNARAMARAHGHQARSLVRLAMRTGHLEHQVEALRVATAPTLPLAECADGCTCGRCALEIELEEGLAAVVGELEEAARADAVELAELER